MAITPTREQFTEFAHGSRDGEVVMLNLLHFARAGTEAGAAARQAPPSRPAPPRTATTATRSSRWSRPAADV